MPVPRRAVTALVRWGVRYAPIAYAGWRGLPLASAGRAGRAGRGDPDDARSCAIEHAEHLIDGSLLPVFHGDTKIWVVFSADEPVGSHPVVRVPLPTLLEYYDLTKRVSPQHLSAAPAAPSAPMRGPRQWSSDRLMQRRPGRLRHRVARLPRGPRARRPAGSV